jgi:hypothetical protein
MASPRNPLFIAFGIVTTGKDELVPSGLIALDELATGLIGSGLIASGLIAFGIVC